MELERYPVEKITREIKGILDRHLSRIPYQAFYFGSRVNGTHNASSDIDVALKTEEKIPLTVLGNIRDDMEELPTLYRVDVVDLKRVSPEFAEVSGKKMEPIR